MQLERSLDMNQEAGCSRSDREALLRLWISQKNTICPYAPGFAYYFSETIAHAEDDALVEDLIFHLEAFFLQRNEYPNLERFIFLPSTEWRSHEEARSASCRLFWLLEVAMYRVANNQLAASSAAARRGAGIIECRQQGIKNPVLGAAGGIDVSRRLYCTGFYPAYDSKQFSRYAPVSCLVLVYESALVQKRERRPNIAQSIFDDVLYGNLQEGLRGRLSLSKKELLKEKWRWLWLVSKMHALVSSKDIAKPSGNVQTMLDQISLNDAEYIFGLAKHIVPNLVAIQKQTKKSVLDILKCAFDAPGLVASPRYLL